MKKEVFAASLAVTFLFLILIISVSFTPAFGEPTNVTFQVNLTITGNTGPSISWVQSGVNANPVESGTRTVWIAFNATDPNTYEDIDRTTAQLILTLSGEEERAASCTNYKNESPNTMYFNCSVTLNYYDKDGNWQINASVEDNSAAYAEDTTETFSYGTLYAIRTNIQGISFGSVNLGQDTGASNDPMKLNNTGNQNFTSINITAYDLVGANPAYTIAASNFYVNATNDAFGIQLTNNSMAEITGASIARDIGGSDTVQDIYFWVSVPSAGLSNQLYTSHEDWIIEVG